MAHDESPVEGEPSHDHDSRGPSAVEVAKRVLLRVEEGAYATLALSGELSRSRLTDAGRGLCTELVYGSLRKQARLDRVLVALASRGLEQLDPQVRALLRLGVYQLLFTRVPPPRVVSQIVLSIRLLRGPGLGGFANALLRRLVRDGEPPQPALPPESASDAEFIDALASRHGLPRLLVRDGLALQGRAGAAALCESLETAAPVWLRLNPLRGPREASLAALLAEDVDVAQDAPIDGLPEALRLRSGHPFAGPAYGDGRFTAQDLGAQLVARLLLAEPEVGKLALPEGAILDACAGVGGKTTHLAALTANRRDIDAADSSSRKLDLCRDHAHRLGCRRVHTFQVDLLEPAAIAAHLRPQYAAVLLDAPCSGVGVLRRHPEARRRLSAAQVRELSAMQRRLLENLAPLIVPGGVLVYAVCSFLRAEGPEQLETFLQNHPDFTQLPPNPSAPLWQGRKFPLLTLPSQDDADGFYAVRLRRR
jgi:16S rRNA (cytosine967-C5)-methyltransferase